MFADKPERVALDRVGPGAAAVRKRIFGDDSNTPQARPVWLQF
jgi:hypothetical protein